MTGEAVMIGYKIMLSHTGLGVQYLGKCYLLTHLAAASRCAIRNSVLGGRHTSIPCRNTPELSGLEPNVR